MMTKKNAARAAVKAAACLNGSQSVTTSPCTHCKAMYFDTAPADVFDRTAEQSRQKYRDACTLVAESQKPCIKAACISSKEQARTDCQRIFNATFPDDVIYPIRTAADTLYWLEQVFNTIAADPAANERIKRMADMGSYLAGDIANLVDAEFDKMHAAMKKGGAA